MYDLLPSFENVLIIFVSFCIIVFLIYRHIYVFWVLHKRKIITYSLEFRCFFFNYVTFKREWQIFLTDNLFDIDLKRKFLFAEKK